MLQIKTFSATEEAGVAAEDVATAQANQWLAEQGLELHRVQLTAQKLRGADSYALDEHIITIIHDDAVPPIPPKAQVALEACWDLLRMVHPYIPEAVIKDGSFTRVLGQVSEALKDTEDARRAAFRAAQDEEAQDDA